MLDTTHPSTHCREHVLVSDTGYIPQLNRPARSGDAVCDILDGLSRLVLSTLAAEVPTIDWPDGTAGRYLPNPSRPVAEPKPSQVCRLRHQHQPTFGAFLRPRPSRPVPLLIQTAGVRAS